MSYLQKVSMELIQKCHTVIETVQKYCLDQAQNYESVVFFLKLLADYNRYINEHSLQLIKLTSTHIESIPNFQQSIENMENTQFLARATQINKEAQEQCIYFYELGKKTGYNIKPTSFVKLGLLLNYSIFKSQVLNDPASAIQQMQEGL